MSFKRFLESTTGIFIFIISTAMFCSACFIFKIFCSWGVRDTRQRSKIVPVKEEVIELTINPYNFVKVIETDLNTIHENLNEKEIAYIEI